MVLSLKVQKFAYRSLRVMTLPIDLDLDGRDKFIQECDFKSCRSTFRTAEASGWTGQGYLAGFEGMANV